MTARRIPELDALRGFVAMLVVVHHLFVIFPAVWANHLPAPAYRLLDFVKAQNKRAVLTFFVVSGYAIALVAVQRNQPLGLGLRGQLLTLGVAALAISLVANQIAPSPFSNFLGLWIVWLIGYVALDLERSRRAMAFVAVPVALAGLGCLLLHHLGRASATLTDAFSGTVIGLAFALAAMCGRWEDFAVVRRFRRAFGVLFCPWLERETGAILHRMVAPRMGRP